MIIDKNHSDYGYWANIFDAFHYDLMFNTPGDLFSYTKDLFVIKKIVQRPTDSEIDRFDTFNDFVKGSGIRLNYQDNSRLELEVFDKDLYFVWKMGRED